MSKNKPIKISNMIKVKMGGLYILGLSAENIKRLKDDQPIYFDLAELGLKGKMSIIYGETEQSLTDMILDLKSKGGQG